MFIVLPIAFFVGGTVGFLTAAILCSSKTADLNDELAAMKEEK